MTAYIWDLDGTLLDSYGNITEAAFLTGADAGVKDTEESVLRAVKQQSVSFYLKDVSARTGEAFEDLLRRYRTYTHRTDGRIGLVRGAKEALERTALAGAVHFVYTHRGSSSGPILERLGIMDCFREVVTSVYGFAPKPSGDGVRYLTEKYGLDPARTWYAGDRAIDVLCAKDAGVLALLYLEPGTCVSPTGQEDRIIHDMEEL